MENIDWIFVKVSAEIEIKSTCITYSSTGQTKSRQPDDMFHIRCAMFTPSQLMVPKTSLVKNGCTGHVLIYLQIDRLTCSPIVNCLGSQISILIPNWVLHRHWYTGGSIHRQHY